MSLFRIQNGKAVKILPKDVPKEKLVQTIFEENLEELLGIKFISSEFSTSSGGRIDTLGIDNTGSPVIIEYKKTQNESIINQGVSYLKWLLDHKEKFENLVTEKLSNIVDSPVVSINGQIVTKEFVDWDQPRVICIAESYSKFDLDTLEMLRVKVELFKYRMYGDEILSIELESDQKVSFSIPGGTKLKTQNNILQKEYSIENHLQKASPEITALFYQLREKITSLDEEIREEPKKHYIAYKLASNFVDVEIRSNEIKVYLNIKSGQLDDPQHIARDLTKPKPIGKWGNGDYDLLFSTEDQLDYVFGLIKQSYNFNK